MFADEEHDIERLQTSVIVVLDELLKEIVSLFSPVIDIFLMMYMNMLLLLSFLLCTSNRIKCLFIKGVPHPSTGGEPTSTLGRQHKTC